jgi:hypothetical protein
MAKFLVMLLLLAACGAPAARPISAPEAEHLARVRAEAKAATIHARIPTGAGILVLTGRVDFVDRVGEATMTTEGRTDPASAGPIKWDPAQLAFQGRSRALRRDGSELDATLLLLVSLHADRPDPAELRRSVRWLRSEDLAGAQVDVFEGDRLTYWVDAEANLRRLQARLGDSQPVVIDLSPSASAAGT